MQMHVKLLTDTAKVPERAYPTSAGLDLFYDGPIDVMIGVGGRVLLSTGVAMAIPEGHYGRIAPRSGLALRDGISVMGGVVDSEYRGELFVTMHNCSGHRVTVSPGAKIAQLIVEVIALPELIVVDDLDSTQRGSNGYGSTGG